MRHHLHLKGHVKEGVKIELAPLQVRLDQPFQVDGNSFGFGGEGARGVVAKEGWVQGGVPDTGGGGKKVQGCASDTGGGGTGWGT